MESNDCGKGPRPGNGDGMREMAREDGSGVPAMRAGVPPLRQVAGEDLEALERDAVPVGAAVCSAPLRMSRARGEDDERAVGGAGVALHGSF